MMLKLPIKKIEENKEEQAPITARGRNTNVPSGIVTDRSDFKDASLGLITSARGVTIKEVADSMFGGNQLYVLHKLIFKKEFPALLKIFKSNKLGSDVIDQKDH